VKDARPEFFEATEKTHPMGHIGDVTDVANAVVFLASPAAKHINGANLTVDGGFMKRVDF
jgi:3-oxoacyl-[acyl-carrier protein] reductase